MALTLEKQNEIEQRNAEIYERFCNLSEEQPLAYRQTIITFLSKEYELSPQMISLIVKTAEQKQQQ